MWPKDMIKLVKSECPSFVNVPDAQIYFSISFEPHPPIVKGHTFKFKPDMWAEMLRDELPTVWVRKSEASGESQAATQVTVTDESVQKELVASSEEAPEKTVTLSIAGVPMTALAENLRDDPLSPLPDTAVSATWNDLVHQGIYLGS